MKGLFRWSLGRRRAGQGVAIFGGGRLIELADGQLELVGGSSDDFTNAQEWVCLFSPDKVIRPTPAAAGTYGPGGGDWPRWGWRGLALRPPASLHSPCARPSL